MRSVFPDTLAFFDEMAYRVLVPGDKIADDPATRRLVDRFQSTIWYDPDRHLMHYMIRGGECLNAVAIVPCGPEIAEKWTAPAMADELVDAFPGWDDRIAVMLSKAEGDASAWAMYRCRDLVWVDGFDERS
jgi:salicylate hydroxylase